MRKHNLPGPWQTMDPIQGNQEEITQSIINGTTHELFKEWRDKYGSVFVFYEKGLISGRLTARLVIGDPHIARSLIKSFGQKIPGYEDVYVLGPHGVLSTNNYQTWLKQRTELAPVLSHSSVVKKTDVIVDDYYKFLHHHIVNSNHDSIDLYPTIVNTTFRMLIHSAFGKDVNFSDDEIDTIREAIDDCVIKGVMTIPQNDPDHKASIDIVNNFIDKIRANTNIDPNSIYGVIRKTQNDREIFTLNEQNNLITTFLFAGHETTAKTVYWTIIELARNPDIQERLYKDIVDFESKSGKYERLVDLKYLTNVIYESMRMWPVVSGGSFRHISKQTEILGDVFEENDAICFNIDLPHSSETWKDPTVFRPDRERNPSHFYPFSLPPRDCLGKNMALLEIRIILYLLVKEFSIRMKNPNTKISGYYVGTMKVREDVELILEPRNIVRSKL